MLSGTASRDIIHGYGGADTISGRGGSDTVHAGRGADKVYGGPGADTLLPGNDARTDVLRGGAGPDRIVARTGPGVGRDYVYAGDGNDVVTLAEVWGWYMPAISCGRGYDTLVLPKGMDVGDHLDGCEHIVHGSR